MQKLARMIDHTVLKPDATEQDIIKACQEAKEYEFASVCVNPYNVSLAREQLEGSGVKVCTGIEYPLGATTTNTKVFEAKDAIDNGAQELDMVINIGALKSKKYDLVEKEIQAVVEVCRGKVLFKVILETCLLSEEEKVIVCQMAKKAGADFIKTSTGVSTGGATVEDIKLIRKTVGQNIGVKASGGIRSYETAIEMIKAGANRIGCSSPLTIIKGCTK